MKKSIIITLAVIIVCTACNSSATKESNVSSSEQSDQLYACPMHPDITGKKGDECSKCGMELTEPVTATPAETSTTTQAADSLSSN